MKCTVLIDRSQQEFVEIHARSLSKEVRDIKAFVEGYENSVVGYIEEEMVSLSLSEIYCFTVEDSRIFAYTKDKKYRLKQRLYQVEEMLSEDFIKFNQSCIGAVSKVQKFEAPLSGVLNVVFKNGHKDFVSRRNLKAVKERFLR